LNTMHERDRQTDKQTDHGTVTSMPIGEIAFHRCRLKYVYGKNFVTLVAGL